MRNVFKTSFGWQFAGGFVLGAVGLITLQPAEATKTLTDHLATAAHLSR